MLDERTKMTLKLDACALVEPPNHLGRVEGGRFAFCVPLPQLLGRLVHASCRASQFSRARLRPRGTA